MDFSKVAQEAARVAASDTGNSRDFKYRLVYPGEGKLKVRILFNPKSGLVSRLITRHNIEKNKIVCASTYSSRDDCPICQVLKEIKNAGMSYPREYDAKTRAIYFAQYISSDYEIADGKLNRGDIFMLMLPWTMYRKINKWIADFSEDTAAMTKVFGSREYFAQVIERGKEGTDWEFRIDPNIVFESAKTDDEFAQMLEGIDSLNEVMGLHETITQEEVSAMRTAADGLRDSFLAVNPTKESAPPVNPSPINAASVAAASSSNVETVSQSATNSQSSNEDNSDKPSCWGHYVGPDNTDPTKKTSVIRCKYCPFNEICKVETDKNLPF